MANEKCQMENEKRSSPIHHPKQAARLGDPGPLAMMIRKYDLRHRAANSPKSMTTNQLDSDYLLAALKTFLSGEMNR